MKYNFDEIVNRKNTNSYKWDSFKEADVLPMWVADMDFKTAQPVIDALAAKVQEGVYGYGKVPEAYFEAVANWFEKRHQFKFNKNHLLHTIGVVPAISAIVKEFTQPGDAVIIQTPVYNCFFSAIKNNDRLILENELINNNGDYTINFEDLEQKAAQENTKLLLLCNPHNPVGRVWTKEELTRIGEICIQHNVLILSDEIHCDLIAPDFKHLCFGSIGERFLEHSITFTAPSKTFNLAGLQVANVLVANDLIREKVSKALSTNEITTISPFAITALMAAYTEGEEWLNQLNAYLQENYQYLKQFFAQYLPHLKVSPLESTYLVWVNCKELGLSSQEISNKLKTEGQLFINQGSMYGSAGEGFIRINIACPKALLIAGLEKIKAVFNP